MLQLYDKVRFKRPYELPGLRIKKGETGQILRRDGLGTIWVEMDRRYKKLRVLENQVPVEDDSFVQGKRGRPSWYLKVTHRLKDSGYTMLFDPRDDR